MEVCKSIPEYIRFSYFIIHSTVSSKLLGIGIRNKNVFVEIFLGRWHTKFGSLMFTNIKVMRTATPTSAWDFFLQRAVISHYAPTGRKLKSAFLRGFGYGCGSTVFCSKL